MCDLRNGHQADPGTQEGNDSEKLTELFAKFPGARIVMKASTPTHWIDWLAKEVEHETVIANPRCIPITTKSIRKCGVRDARILGELGQVQPGLLSPITL